MECSFHFPYYIEDHKRYIAVIAGEAENVSIWVYLSFHKVHRCEVRIYEIGGHTTNQLEKNESTSFNAAAELFPYGLGGTYAKGKSLRV